MNKSFHIHCLKLFIVIFALIALTGCSLAPGYTDPDTGKLEAEAARISLLKKSSIKTIYSTDTNVFFIMNNAAVLASGCNDYGLLGQGDTDKYDYVVHVKLPERIKLISADGTIAAAVSDTNNVYIWGDLSRWNSGSLTTTDDNFTYKKFSFTEIVTDISVNTNHIAVLTKKGTVYTLGYNYGQLGYDLSENFKGRFYSDFRKIETDVFATKIETSPTATYMISDSGQIYGCSYNEYYELGYIDSLGVVNRIDSTALFTSLTTAGHNLFALSSDGDVYVCGQNTNGVLGLNSTLATAAALTKVPFDGNIKIKSICGRDSNSTVFFLTTENKVYACGTNTTNELYTENTSVAVTAPSLVKIGEASAFYGMGASKFYLDARKHLYTYGDNTYGQMPTVETSNKGGFVMPTRIYANVK